MTKRISKILIANRGEIACRVIKTARRMGIRTVAVYSDADAGALHVAEADEAVRIGPAPAAESYLNAAAIIGAARTTGADAIHPGYGFLSENPEFVDAVEKAGLIFIGPPASAIRAMGLKDAAKALMEKAKVPVVPGYHGEAQELVVLGGKASEIGFPVLIKARAGGGGKGMRKVEKQADFADALGAAKREAKASFGDDRVLVEKYVATPRHVEIQVFADSHGNAVYLFERDCSLQRRHQKVIEEAPAPGMGAEMRAAMGDAAVKAAKAIGYAGAGTVEFIADASEGLKADRFWFMEMNTRLQVEHPVTEAITGLDLVEMQIRVAAGEKLPLSQDDLTIDGHAFEARIYAEDAAKGFLPATGRIAHLSFPEQMARVDSGVRAGDTITPFYDPMIAKLIVHGADRAEALAKLTAALEATEIVGTVTNLDFLTALSRHEDFVAGKVDTGLIERALSALTVQRPVPAPAIAIGAIAASGMAAPRTGDDPFDTIGPWAKWGEPRRDVELEMAGETRSYTVSRTGGTNWRVTGESLSAPVSMALELADDGLAQIGLQGHAFTARAVRSDDALTVIMDSRSHVFGIADAVHGAEAAAGGDRVVAPMPGVVKSVMASVGATVTEGQALVVMEAMKMELTLPAPRDGTVLEVLVSENAQVSDGAVLVQLEAAES